MDLQTGLFVALAIVVLGAVGLTGFALWIRHTSDHDDVPHASC